MEAELADELQRKRAEVDARKAQAALEVEVEGRPTEREHQGVCNIFHPSLLLLLLMLLLLIASSFVLSCSYLDKKILSSSPFAHHQLIY